MADEKEAVRFVADIEASKYARLFNATRNGIFIWKAYKVYRSRSLAVPEHILKAIDAVSDRLLNAKGPHDMPKALFMGGNKKGGASGVTRAHDIEWQYDVVEAVVREQRKDEHEGQHRNAEDIYRLVARRFSTPEKDGDVKAKHVKAIYLEWRKNVRPDTAGVPDAWAGLVQARRAPKVAGKPQG